MNDDDAVSAESKEQLLNAQEGEEGFNDAAFMESLAAIANGTKTAAAEEVLNEDEVIVGGEEGDDPDLAQAPEKTATSQKVAEVVKTGSDIRPEKTAEEIAAEGTRNRVDLNHLDPLKAQTMRFAAQYPDITIAAAEAMARTVLNIPEPTEDDGTVAYEDLSAAEKLTVDEPELKEVEDQIIERERLGIKDEAWETLVRQRNDLQLKIAMGRVEAAQQEAKAADWSDNFSKAEAAIIGEFPEVADPNSELFYLVSARTSQLVAQAKQGKAPDWYDPTKVESLRRIVTETKARLDGGKTAPEAKPGANDAAQRSQTTKIGGLPAKASLSQVMTRPAPGIQQDETVELDASASDDDFMAALAKITSRNQPAAKNGQPARPQGKGAGRFQLV